jgi:hypothetical protein
MSIDVQDYHTGDPVNLQDPTDPNEEVERILMDKLGEFVTRTEEVLSLGTADFDSEDFIMSRGSLLDMFQDQDISTWLHNMRQLNRVRFRKFAVTDDTPIPEKDNGESK